VIGSSKTQIARHNHLVTRDLVHSGYVADLGNGGRRCNGDTLRRGQHRGRGRRVDERGFVIPHVLPQGEIVIASNSWCSLAFACGEGGGSDSDTSDMLFSHMLGKGHDIDTSRSCEQDHSGSLCIKGVITNSSP
jgi:hypothetical protein